ncbi:hypothetical protein LWC34_35080 [Kibdelosporangium philippinense]|uniref:ATP/GTP-binding protein n=1 Tax=Kibdelosporangium philippinense TaxID=211113 RepID=A0ABS8ZJP4_9PSEU|nr:hypothetical protein [Kibdelosporangium philippinense]MCE7008009.1 hypothetical protein [Kibdelosporangium philippinense]
MPRRNRTKRDEPRISGAASLQRSEQGPDGDWYVRAVSGTATTKTYRCPGCDHEIRPGTPHVVTWPADDYGSVEERRHWHRACWEARLRRKPTRRA